MNRMLRSIPRLFLCLALGVSLGLLPSLGSGCASSSSPSPSPARSGPGSLSNGEFIDKLVSAIVETNLLNELPKDAQSFAAAQLSVSPARLATIRTFRIPLPLMASIVSRNADARNTWAFFFVRRDAFTQDALIKLGQWRKLNFAEAEDLFVRIQDRLFREDEFAILIPPDLATADPWHDRIFRNSCLLHELYHYYQYLHHNLPVYHSREVSEEIEAQAYAFQMRYLASEGLTGEQVVHSFCKLQTLPEKQAQRKRRAFVRSDFGRFLRTVWEQRVAPLLPPTSAS